MSRTNRERRESNDRRRVALGIDGSSLPRAARRSLERAMRGVPILDDVRHELAGFSVAALLELISRNPRQEPPFLIARLVREVVRTDGDGRRVPTESDLKRLLSKLANLADPEITRNIGGNFPEIVLNRIAAPQLFEQREFLTEIPRVLSVLAEPDPSSMLGPAEWKRLLGLDLIQFVVGVKLLTGALEQGPLDLEAYLAIDGRDDVDDWVRSAVAILAGDLLAFKQVALTREQRCDSSDYHYDPGPLLELPIFRRADGLIAAPAVDYLRLAATCPSLYIRLIRADIAEGTRSRSGSVGSRLQAHLLEYAAGIAAAGWQVRNLDREPAPRGKVADIAIWPEDMSFLLVVEAKANLQAFEAQLGHAGKIRDAVANIYQKSFRQIDATVAAVNQNGFLADARVNVPVFGLAVTFDLHLTTVINENTYFGSVLDYRHPQGPYASSTNPCRVVSVDDFESIADILSWAEPLQVLQVLSGVFKEKSPARTMRKIVFDQLSDSMPEQPRINPLIIRSFERTAASLTDPVLAEQIRSIAASLAA